MLIICLFLLLSCSIQNKSNFIEYNNDIIDFEIIQLNKIDENYSMQLYLRLPINKMVFNKNFNIFVSNITIDILISNEENKIVYSNSFEEEIIKEYYEDTKNENIHLINYLFNLPPGIYFINIIINDYINHITYKDKDEFEIFHDENFSSLLVYHKINNEYKYYFESKENDSIDTLWVNCNIIEKDEHNQNTLNLSYEFYYQNKLILNHFFEDTIKNVVYYYPIPLIDDSFDKLEINLTYKDYIKSKMINFTNRINYNYDYELIIGPMQYVLDIDNYIKFNELDSLDRINYVKKYWSLDIFDKNDHKTELFKEFYTRVVYTNETFMQLNREGWDTDRGTIYITYGKPNDIKYDFNQHEEFEIWYYNNKEFIFLNKYGIYELYDNR